MSRFYEEIDFIGKVHSELNHKINCPKMEYEQAPPAEIEIFSEFSDGLSGIETGCEVFIFTWLHEADRTVLNVHPRGDLSKPLTGVFSTRSPDRPNPVGIHKTKITDITDNTILHVSSLEVLNETPVIDIKRI